MNDQGRKLFPRNLTARAAHFVTGNPISSRPESGVDTSAPGLEFDQRNIEALFFPGLRFEFHPARGARVAAIEQNDAWQSLGFTADRLLPHDGPAAASDAPPPLYIVCIVGRTALEQDPANPPLLYCGRMAGVEVWSHIRLLLDERVTIMLGTHPETLSPNGAFARWMLGCHRNQSMSFEQDPRMGPIAILNGTRRHYLDEAGVIDTGPGGFVAGDLTRTMCNPWQYDFRECGCFYWASNRPDLVTAPQTATATNWLRRPGSEESPPPPSVTTDPPDLLSGALASHQALMRLWDMDAERDVPDLVSNWHRLPLVIDGIEGAGTAAPTRGTGAGLLDREGIISKLTQVAQVEHALLVEYLYAYYSLRLPPAGGRDDPIGVRVKVAGDFIYRIAIDEMRHFRWANELLERMGAPHTVGRAARIPNMDLPPDSTRPFELSQLTHTQLARLIRAEQASQSDDGLGVDGIYVEILRSLAAQPTLFEQGRRLAEVVKLIIDEGADHHRSLQSVEAVLSGLREEEFLRNEAPAQTAPLRSLADVDVAIDMSNQYYSAFLAALDVGFGQGYVAGRGLIRQAIRSMRNMHEVNLLVAQSGADIPFALTASAGLVRSRATSGEVSSRLRDLDYQHSQLAERAGRPAS